mmetsp:Transcript_16294/g.35221  ORF Transcript_16294/g.35221 Transcript_16294/m.35221 type:complete len:218 (+) Transcript_16294:279-932(+)
MVLHQGVLQPSLQHRHSLGHLQRLLQPQPLVLVLGRQRHQLGVCSHLGVVQPAQQPPPPPLPHSSWAVQRRPQAPCTSERHHLSSQITTAPHPHPAPHSTLAPSPQSQPPHLPPLNRRPCSHLEEALLHPPRLPPPPPPPPPPQDCSTLGAAQAQLSRQGLLAPFSTSATAQNLRPTLSHLAVQQRRRPVVPEGLRVMRGRTQQRKRPPLSLRVRWV